MAYTQYDPPFRMRICGCTAHTYTGSMCNGSNIEANTVVLVAPAVQRGHPPTLLRGLIMFLDLTTSSLSGFCAAVESYWALAWPCGTLRGPMSDAGAGRGADLAARSARAAEPIIVASAQSIKRTHGAHEACSAFQDAYLWLHCTYLHRKYLQQQ